MNLFAISDLHLSFGIDKPMNIFGDNWTNHFDKIKKNWLNMISENDYVLLCGDLSWAMNLKDAQKDLNWVNSLPGTKILIKGNHDFWWSGIHKLNSLYTKMIFLQNNYIPFKDFAICGSRGINIELNDEDAQKHQKILEREKIRMKLSLESAKKDGFKKFIYMIHYPPFVTNKDCYNKNTFLNILNEYNIHTVVYGHIHSNFPKFLNTNINNTNYMLTSCDYLNFSPVKIL